MLKRLSARPTTSGPRGLPGRVDAFGNARNALFTPPVPTNAPVSFPHLWGLTDLTWVHWDGNSTSVMERNLGQAIGLGAIVNRTTNESTLLPRNIHKLEMMASKIESPKWPSDFPAVDTEKAKRGAVIYKQQCISCHETSSAAHHQKKLDDALFSPALIKTDANRLTNFGMPVDHFASHADAIAKTIGAIKKQAYIDSGIDAATADAMEKGRTPAWRVTGQFSSRSLAGSWATAPYLHNNSVPTIYDLLKPAKQRPTVFLIPGREYNPKNLGFVYQQSDNRAAFKETDPVLDVSEPGNSNSGHEGPKFGTELSDADRYNLIEYLKTI